MVRGSLGRVGWGDSMGEGGKPRVREGSMRHAGSILAPPRLTTHIYGVWLPLAGIVAPHHTIHLGVLCHDIVPYSSGVTPRKSKGHTNTLIPQALSLRTALTSQAAIVRKLIPPCHKPS